MSQGPTKGVPIDTDGSLSANLDTLVPSEKAVKTYVDSHVLTAIAGNMFSSYIVSDPNISLGSTYERESGYPTGVATGAVQLKANPLWNVTIANAKTSPPTLWAWNANIANVTAADENTTTANGLYIHFNDATNYDWLNGTTTYPLLYKVYGGVYQEFIMKFVAPNQNAANKGAGFGISDNQNASTKFFRVGVANSTLAAYDGTLNASVSVVGFLTTGIWVRVIRIGGYCNCYYSTANQSTPPATWTSLGGSGTSISSGGTINAGFWADRFNATGTNDISIMYFDDSRSEPSVNTGIVSTNGVSSANGFDTVGVAQTLIASFDLGATSATINDTTLQSALTQSVNQRSYDAATWTFSAVRGSSVNPSAGSYTSAATTTVVGTGRYFALYTKCVSSGSTQGSLILPNIVIPYAAPAVSVGISTKNYIQTDRNLSTGTDYERINYFQGGIGGLGLIQIKPNKAFAETIANAKTTPNAGGWSYVVANTNLTSADSNTTTANSYHMLHNTSSTEVDSGGTIAGPYYAKTYESMDKLDIVARLGNMDNEANFITTFNINTHGTVNRVFRFSFSNSNVSCQYDAGGSSWTTLTGPTNIGSGPFGSAGAWVRFRKTGTAISGYYSTTNQATPPTTWTLGGSISTVFAQGEESVDVGIGVVRLGATSNTAAADLLYYDDTYSFNPVWMQTNTADLLMAACGFSSSNTALTLVASFDLGTQSAVISDTTLQAALTEITNPRATDSGTWTYSAVRANSANPAASTYQSAATCSVSGTGQYFALYAKCSSTNRIQPGSIDTARLLIPYTGASGGGGGTIVNSSVGTVNVIPKWDGAYSLADSIVSESVSGPSDTVTISQSVVANTKLVISNSNGTANTFQITSSSGGSSIGTTTNDTLTLITNNTNKVLVATSGAVSFGTGFASNYPSDSPMLYVSNTSANALANFTATSAGGSGAQVILRADGTGGGGTVTISGNVLGFIGFKGKFNATTFTTASSSVVTALATETWSSGVQGSSLVFKTTPNGTATALDRLTIGNDGIITAGVSYTGAGTGLTGTAASLTAGTATNAVNSAITNDTTTNATMFPMWVTANTGNLPIKVTSTKLTFNPSTGVLATTTFSGAGTSLTGTGASFTAGTATNANNLAITTPGASTYSILFATGATGNQAVFYQSAGLTISSVTGLLSVAAMTSTGLITGGNLKATTTTPGATGTDGTPLILGTTYKTTIGANGGSTALTANPVAYLTFTLAGTLYQFPFYNV